MIEKQRAQSCFHMVFVIIGASPLSGGRSNKESVGGSVANANAAKLSIIKFTHNNRTDVKGNFVVDP